MLPASPNSHEEHRVVLPGLLDVLEVQRAGRASHLPGQRWSPRLRAGDQSRPRDIRDCGPGLGLRRAGHLCAV